MINISEDALIIKLAYRLQIISDAFTATERFRNKYFEETTTNISELEKNRSFNRIHLQLIGDIKSKLDNISTIFKIKRFGEI
jgi:hypothetical protein